MTEVEQSLFKQDRHTVSLYFRVAAFQDTQHKADLKNNSRAVVRKINSV